jgi:inner membrane protein
MFYLQYTDINRFNWFSQGYLGIGRNKNIITDVRYSAVPNEVNGLWGIEIDLLKNNTEHVDWVVNRRNFSAQWDKFIGLLLGKNCRKTVN